MDTQNRTDSIRLRRIISVGTVVAVLFLGPAWTRPSDAAAAKAEYGVKVERDVRVAMRDAVRLATDIYIPTVNGRPLDEKLPVVLIRTAYNKQGFAQRGDFFARHGYLAVTQDVRGRFASEGEFYPFVNEPEDGYDTMAWLSGHPRCNGKVATYGCSYMAWVQLSMASLKPPGLVAMLVDGVGINTYHHVAYPYGARQLGLVRWVIDDVWPRSHEARKPEVRKAIESVNFLEMASQLPWERGKTPLAISPRFEKLCFDYVENDSYSDYWRQRGLGFDEYFESFPDIPIMWQSGWYDGYPRSVFEGYRKMVALGRGKNQWVICGPWIHNRFGDTTCGDVDFGSAAGLSRLGVQLAWFDRWLRGDANADIGPHIRAFVMGGGSGVRTAKGRLHHGGKWYLGDTWPPPATRPTPFYLCADGGLSPQPPAPAASSSTTYSHDPRDPVPSMICPWTFHGHVPKGPWNQVEQTKLLGQGKPGRPLAERPDVVVFQTPLLEESVRLLGPVKVMLWISSNSPDTDFAAKLVDVYPPSDDYPNGYALGICEGLLPARYRNGLEKPELLEPGKPYRLEIVLFPAANLFCKGHRIRLDIASSNFPRYEINRNTGDPSDASVRVAKNTVYHDREHASAMILPVLP